MVPYLIMSAEWSYDNEGGDKVEFILDTSPRTEMFDICQGGSTGGTWALHSLHGGGHGTVVLRYLLHHLNVNQERRRGLPNSPTAFASRTRCSFAQHRAACATKPQAQLVRLRVAGSRRRFLTLCDFFVRHYTSGDTAQRALLILLSPSKSGRLTVAASLRISSSLIPDSA